jgi:5'-3' exonuclease
VAAVSRVYLIDGTYELFRHFFAVPSQKDVEGNEVAAVRGVLASVLVMLRDGATHIGVATDHVVESFRNDLWAGYKTGAGIEPELFAQFPMLEDALAALGVVVWPMVEYEADDALASAAAIAAGYAEQVVICTPDKDLSQCVVGTHIVQLDRRANTIRDEDGVIARFGVAPASIPDYLALVGDSADGFPGLSGWGAKSAAAILSKFRRIEDIPADPADWGVTLRSVAALSATLEANRDLALLFKDLATLRAALPIEASAEGLRWRGPRKDFGTVAAHLEAPGLAEFAAEVASTIR